MFPFARTIETNIATIPTPKDIYCAIFVFFLSSKSFEKLSCISNVQLVATEFSPVDSVD